MEYICLVAFIVLNTILSLAQTCPDDVTKGVFECLKYVASTDTSLSGMQDVEKLHSKCLDGSFDVTLSCVTDLKLRCRFDEQRLGQIKETVSVEKMEKAFRETCQNINVLYASANCVTKYKDRINRCSQSVHNEYVREKQTGYQTGSTMQLHCSEPVKLKWSDNFTVKASKPLMEHFYLTFYNLSKSVLDGLTRCSERPIRIHCSEESADLTVSLMEGLKPPACPAYVSRSCAISLKPVIIFLCSICAYLVMGL